MEKTAKIVVKSARITVHDLSRDSFLLESANFARRMLNIQLYLKKQKNQ